VLYKKERNVTELAEHLQRSQSTVSRHLKERLNRGLVRNRREGPAVNYSLANALACRTPMSGPGPLTSR